MVGGISGVGSFGMGSVGSFYQSRLTENIRNARNAQQSQQAPQTPELTVRKAASPETPVQPVGAVRPVTRDEVSVPELTQRLENDAAAMAGRMRTQYGSVNKDGVFMATGKESLSPVQDSRKNALEGQLSQAENAMARNDLENAEDVLNGGAPEIPDLPGQADEKTVPGVPGQEDKTEIPGLPSQKDGEDAKEPVGAEGVQKAVEDGKCETCEKRKYQDGSDDPGVSFKTPTNIRPEQAASAVRGHEREHVVREQAKAEREGREVVSQNVTIHTEICPECGKAYVSGGTTRTVTKAASDNDIQQQQQQQQQQEQENQKTALPKL